MSTSWTVHLQLSVPGAYPDIPDKHGMTPLMYSVQVEWLHLTQLFLEAGAQVNWQDKKGRTALHIAAETQDPRWANRRIGYTLKQTMPSYSFRPGPSFIFLKCLQRG